MKSILNRKNFTLIELLVVIAIIAILLTLLVPSLANARYEAMRAVCLSNMKQYGGAIMLHCNDNDRRYPNYYGDTNTTPYRGIHYGSQVFHRMNSQIYPIFEYMGFKGNNRFGNTVRDSVTCPFIAQALIRRFTEKGNFRYLDLDGDGNKEKHVKYPFGKSSFNSGFNHYFAIYNKVIEKPMVYQGDRVQIKSGYLTTDYYDLEGSNLLLSDIGELHGAYNTGGYITNHPPRSGQSLIIDERFETPSEIWSHNIKRGYVVTGHFSANYIFADGSGAVRKRVNRTQLVGKNHFYQIPGEFYK